MSREKDSWTPSRRTYVWSKKYVRVHFADRTRSIQGCPCGIPKVPDAASWERRCTRGPIPTQMERVSVFPVEAQNVLMGLTVVLGSGNVGSAHSLIDSPALVLTAGRLSGVTATSHEAAADFGFHVPHVGELCSNFGNLGAWPEHRQQTYNPFICGVGTLRTSAFHVART